MPSPELFRRLTFLGNDVSEEHIASIIKVTRIGELGTMLAVTSNRNTLRNRIIFLRSVHRLLVTANIVPSLDFSRLSPGSEDKYWNPTN
jgi:hypothetical protein